MAQAEMTREERIALIKQLDDSHPDYDQIRANMIFGDFDLAEIDLWRQQGLFGNAEPVESEPEFVSEWEARNRNTGRQDGQ